MHATDLYHIAQSQITRVNFKQLQLSIENSLVAIVTPCGSIRLREGDKRRKDNTSVEGDNY